MQHTSSRRGLESIPTVPTATHRHFRPVVPNYVRLEHTIYGATMKLCPLCKRPRSRKSTVTGPYFRRELPNDKVVLVPRCSDRLMVRIFYHCIFLGWLVLPSRSDRRKNWFDIQYFAHCDWKGCEESKLGWISIGECDGIKKLSRIKRLEHWIRHWLGSGIERVIPKR